MIKIVTRLTLISFFFSFLLVFTSSVFALTVGEKYLESTLNQKLDARVELLNLRRDEVATMSVKLASASIYQRMGIERSPILEKLKFSVKQSQSGQHYIQISSDFIVFKPFFTFLVELNWNNGRLLREFTLFMDPPIFLDENLEALDTASPQNELLAKFGNVAGDGSDDIEVTDLLSDVTSFEADLLETGLNAVPLAPVALASLTLQKKPPVFIEEKPAPPIVKKPPVLVKREISPQLDVKPVEVKVVKRLSEKGETPIVAAIVVPKTALKAEPKVETNKAANLKVAKEITVAVTPEVDVAKVDVTSKPKKEVVVASLEPALASNSIRSIPLIAEVVTEIKSIAAEKSLEVELASSEAVNAPVVTNDISFIETQKPAEAMGSIAVGAMTLDMLLADKKRLAIALSSLLLFVVLLGWLISRLFNRKYRMQKQMEDPLRQQVPQLTDVADARATVVQFDDIVRKNAETDRDTGDLASADLSSVESKQPATVNL